MDRGFDAVEAAIRQILTTSWSTARSGVTRVNWIGVVLYLTDTVTMFNVIDFQVLP